MYLLTYSIRNKKRLKKVVNVCKKYMNRVQKSVFEGELSKSQLFALQSYLKKIINKDEDAITIYLIPRSLLRKKILLGIVPNDPFIIF